MANSKTNPLSLASNISANFLTINDEVTIYINVNYAPNQMDRYVQKIRHATIKAIYDFDFDLQSTKVQA